MTPKGKAVRLTRAELRVLRKIAIQCHHSIMRVPRETETFFVNLTPHEQDLVQRLDEVFRAAQAASDT
jgi:hypothetical protein